MSDLPSSTCSRARTARRATTPNALTTYGDVLKLEPGMWFALRDRGVLRWISKPPATDLVGAEQDLRQAIALQPRYADALQPLGDLLVDTKRYEEGIKVLKRVLDVDPSRDSARVQIVEAYADVGAPGRSRPSTALEVLIRKSPRNLGMRLLKARLVGEAGDPPAAQTSSRPSRDEYPDKPDPLVDVDRRSSSKEKTLDPDEAPRRAGAPAPRLARTTRSASASTRSSTASTASRRPRPARRSP